MNLITGMSYIGQTTRSLKERKSAHLKRVNLSNLKFYNAIKKYGEEKFSWIILKLCKNREELNFWEEFYINRHKTMTPNGYNLTNGGKGSLGLKHKRETRELLSRINSGENHPQYGKQCSEETKRKIGDANKGRKFPEEFGKQMSERLKKLWQNEEYRKRQSISRADAHLGVVTYYKQYIFTDGKGNEFICNKGFAQFCLNHGLNHWTMRKVLSNKTKKSHHNGWKVKYKYDDLTEV